MNEHPDLKAELRDLAGELGYVPESSPEEIAVAFEAEYGYLLCQWFAKIDEEIAHVISERWKRWWDEQYPKVQRGEPRDYEQLTDHELRMAIAIADDRHLELAPDEPVPDGVADDVYLTCHRRCSDGIEPRHHPDPRVHTEYVWVEQHPPSRSLDEQ